ncbi:MAG: 2Fe-2S iron-sulfur cluster-binding protein [Nitrospirota bacterium]|nr:2Fe-2S iron-sulfur cluster-binding protein [Nitrospirota bacterium]MDH5576801.1 2Fe-2S iron-sulfur cluster-binding protein [Nitrospirota bacterium]
MSDTLNKENSPAQEGGLQPKMVTVEIEGKRFQVPAGITLIKALWYTGQDVIRGVGCLGGFCGACATYYRTKDDPKVKTCLACSMAVEDGMSFSFMPAFPARKALYNLLELKDPKQDLFELYPEAPLCRNCNACTEACPQHIDVREGVWKAVFGDFKAVSEMFMDCVMCGMCAPVCIADIAPNLVALYASRAQGAHFTEKPEGLSKRIQEISDGRFQQEWDRILKLSDAELQDATASTN